MIDLEVDAGFQSLLEMIRWLGKEKMRPLGLECDRKDEPLPADHPFFQELWEMMPGGTTELAEDAGKRKTDPSKPSTMASKPTTSGRRAVLMAEEAAYWDRGIATSMPGPGLGGPPVGSMGTPDQKKRFLGMFKESPKPLWAAFGMTEPGAGSDVARIRTRCRKDGDSWVLSGEKCFCTNGGKASWVTVFATVDPALGRAGHRAFVVEKGTPGFRLARVEKKLGLRASETAALVLEDVRVPAENLLGGEAYYEGTKEGFKGAMRAFDLTRPLVAATALGIARAAWDSANDFFLEHHKGRAGRRVSRLSEKLGYARRKIEVGRLLVWRAAWMADNSVPNRVEASMSKAYAPMIAQEAVSLCLEVLGEAGIRHDTFVEKLYRDVKALDIVEGTGQIQRVVIARSLLGFPSIGEQES